MSDRRRPFRRGREQRPESPTDAGDVNPYRDDSGLESTVGTATAPPPAADAPTTGADERSPRAADGAPTGEDDAPRPRAPRAPRRRREPEAEGAADGAGDAAAHDAAPAAGNGAPPAGRAVQAALALADAAPATAAGDAPLPRRREPRRRPAADAAGAPTHATTADGDAGTPAANAPDAPDAPPIAAPRIRPPRDEAPRASAEPLGPVSFGGGDDDAPDAPRDAAGDPGREAREPSRRDEPSREAQRRDEGAPAPAAGGDAPPPREGRSRFRERFERRERRERGGEQPRGDQRPERNERNERQEPRGGRPEGRPHGAPGADRGGPRDAARDGGAQGARDFGPGGGRRRNRHRGRGRPDFVERGAGAPGGPPVAGGGSGGAYPATLVADTAVSGWLDLARDGSGAVRQAVNSYLPAPGDPYVPVHLARQFVLRKGDRLDGMAARDHRGRTVLVELQTVNGAEPVPVGTKRPEFKALLATYPERKLFLETGKVAKTGPELTRRVVDLIAPIGYGQRALIVAPARSGKTMLLQAIVEGVALNHPEAELLILLVDERPEEVSEMVQCGHGEVVASSFDMPAERHREVVEMVMERAHRLVEQGRDVVIVLDSITRMARAFNATKGIGRTLSGGLDATAMATPKAFFGSARSVAPKDGGGSLTIIGTALVETGSRMDDVIFEEFKGTGNCEIKLDRSLAERRIFPAIDVPASGTRREDKLFRPEQLDAVYLLRRGLQNMSPVQAMEWLIKRIGNTPNNDALLAVLLKAASDL